MSFQAYIDKVRELTGKTPEELKQEFEKAGKLNSDIKATDLVLWLKENYDLGRGHSMAIWNVFVSNGWVDTKHTKIKKREIS